MYARTYLLKVCLKDIEPSIWRRFIVPWHISLERLHDVIQIVMGWEDYHLHEFTIGKKKYTEFPESKEDGLECGRYRLGDLIRQNGRTFGYVYDFGDYWEHELVLENSRYFDPDQQFEIVCLEGARSCPPEDVGSVDGYAEYLEAIQDPSNEQHEDMLRWRGPFDPEAFDIHAVNLMLLQYMRWSRDRILPWTPSTRAILRKE